MKQIYNNQPNCIDVFTNEVNTNDPDIFLAEALNYLKQNGMSVILMGFDKYSRPVVEINGVIHTADKCSSTDICERFIMANHNPEISQNEDRLNKINNYLS